MERIILHCDMNNFYASVEIAINPELFGMPIAVCGSVEDRHGIVLAKSQVAKETGIQTGDVVWQAKKKCPNLIVVPPRFDEYAKYSKKAQEIYYRYTDMVEPFGLDECWLDVTLSQKLFGNGEEIANKIRNDIKNELGLTISVGVSFNKIFAKLGSDMKKPDAVTIINREDFREKIWHLNANELIGIGKSTYNKLLSYNIKTIGDLALTDGEFINRALGKNGTQMWNYANGRDFSRVREYIESDEQKSVSNGITCTKDLENNYEVYRVILKLSQDVSKRLRRQGLFAKTVGLSIKDNKLRTVQWQVSLEKTSQSFNEITDSAYNLFTSHYSWQNYVRAVSVRTTNLQKEPENVQLDLFLQNKSLEKKDKLEIAMQDIRDRFGKNIIEVASLTEDIKISKDKTEVKVLPSNMHK
ncbi:MAG: DNA polymerase IV [Clostridia bacterium]